MSGKTSPAPTVFSRSFYGESPPKRSRLHESNNIRPAFRSLKDNLTKFEKKLAEPLKSSELKEPEQQDAGEEPKSLDRDSPIPLKNLGNTCYENSIIQCLFGLNMFMENFERSMEGVRKLVVKPTIKTYDIHVIPEERETETEVTTITENDVRYRIADAFDKLYKSYTHKRNESDNQANRTSRKATHQDGHLDKTNTSIFPSDYETCQSSTAIPLCKSTPGDHSSEQICPNENHTSTSTTDTLASSNLTPIALVSSASTPNEQSEIETRLEDLKSAVGERSSQFNSTHQQDASEFFYHVIDSIQEFYQGLNKIKDEDNPVTKAFELELDYLIRCPKCHHRNMSGPEKIRTLPLALPHVNNETSNDQEYGHEMSGAPTPPTSDLGLDSPESNSLDEHRNCSDEKENQALVDVVVPEDNANNTMSIAKLDLTDKTEQNSPSQQKRHTLCDALDNYFKDDLLDYNCSQPDCDSKQRTKKCLIRKLPQVLFITLARYSYTGKKSLDEIDAPFELSVPFRENKSPSHSPSSHRDLDDEDDDYNKYNLVAVVCHLGSSLNAGHYTSYVYNQNNFSWYSCDDDSITKVQEADVRNDASKSGYCFFYAHKSCINQKSLREMPVDGKKLTGTEAIEVSSSIVNSSVILTPESSPSPSILSHDETEVHEDHACCVNGVDDIDDWS